MGNKLQSLLPNHHSDKVVLAARCIPSDIVLSLTGGQIIALLTNIIHVMDHVADVSRKELKGTD